MPLIVLVALGFVIGLAAAILSARELATNPRPAWALPSFHAFLVYEITLVVPIAVYFYVFHGDWALFYLVDVRAIPSALALVGFAIQAGVGASGFLVGASLERAHRRIAAIGLAIIIVAVTGVVLLLTKNRLAMVGTFEQHQRAFGLVPFGGPLAAGLLTHGAILIVGAGALLARIAVANRKTS